MYFIDISVYLAGVVENCEGKKAAYQPNSGSHETRCSCRVELAVQFVLEGFREKSNRITGYLGLRVCCALDVS
jgi:hypothetical protein